MAARLLKGERGTVIAADLGISKSTVSGMRTGRLWRHLRPAEMR